MMLVWAVAAFSFAVGWFLWMWREANQTKVVKHSITLKRLGENWNETQLFFISDLHRRRLSQETIDQLKSNERIEIVLIGGDLWEKGVPLQQVRRNLLLLKQLGPVYFVYGNHDYEGDFRQFDILLRKEGVQILDNAAVYLQKGQDGLWLVGVDDPFTGRDKLHLAVEETGAFDQCTILLAHDPSVVQRLKANEKVDLTLSGHTHGGQVCVPWFGPVYVPLPKEGKRYISGIYNIQHDSEFISQLLVSRGFGTSHLPIRFLCPPEMHVITLISGKPSAEKAKK